MQLQEQLQIRKKRGYQIAKTGNVYKIFNAEFHLFTYYFPIQAIHRLLEI